MPKRLIILTTFFFVFILGAQAKNHEMRNILNNEDFVGWGREDSEFASRLINFGIKRYNLRFAGIAHHLFHPTSTKERLLQNDSILNDTIKKKKIWCENGLQSHLS